MKERESKFDLLFKRNLILCNETFLMLKQKTETYFFIAYIPQSPPPNIYIYIYIYIGCGSNRWNNFKKLFLV